MAHKNPSSAARYAFTTDYAVIPDQTLQETINALGMDQKDLALRTGLDKKTISQIIKVQAPLTPNTALLLERVTRLPAHFWNNLEANYQQRRTRLAPPQPPPLQQPPLALAQPRPPKRTHPTRRRRPPHRPLPVLAAPARGRVEPESVYQLGDS